MNHPAFYTVKEFASLVRLHPHTVREAIKSGKINAFQLGKKGRGSSFRIPSSEVERLAITTMERYAADFLKNIL